MSHTTLLRLAALSAIFTASILIIAKGIAWTHTGSLSVQASLLDSLLDVLASLINFFVIQQALKPADKEHRFGHGKAEALGGLAQTAFIAGSAIWLFMEAISHFISPPPLTHVGVGNVVMIIAIILTAFLICFQKYVIRKTNSLAIAADSLHYQTDLLSCIGILVGLNLSSTFSILWLDSLVGLGIGVYILVVSYKIGLKSLHILMDHELPDDSREKILKIAQENKSVKGVHDLRTRSSGNQIFIQLHLDMDKTLPLQMAHDEGVRVSQSLRQVFPEADIIIHHDPV